jgi:xanthine/uracil permease
MQAIQFLAQHPLETRVVVHYSAMAGCQYAIGNLRRSRSIAKSPAARLAKWIIGAWFVFLSAAFVSRFESGSWRFWEVIFALDAGLVVAFVTIRRLGLLDPDIADNAVPPGRALPTPK